MPVAGCLPRRVLAPLLPPPSPNPIPPNHHLPPSPPPPPPPLYCPFTSVPSYLPTYPPTHLVNTFLPFTRRSTSEPRSQIQIQTCLAGSRFQRHAVGGCRTAAHVLTDNGSNKTPIKRLHWHDSYGVRSSDGTLGISCRSECSSWHHTFGTGPGNEDLELCEYHLCHWKSIRRRIPSQQSAAHYKSFILSSVPSANLHPPPPHTVSLLYPSQRIHVNSIVGTMPTELGNLDITGSGWVSTLCSAVNASFYGLT